MHLEEHEQQAPVALASKKQIKAYLRRAHRAKRRCRITQTKMAAAPASKAAKKALGKRMGTPCYSADPKVRGKRDAARKMRRRQRRAGRK